MPIHRPFQIESLSTDEFGSLDYSVMGHMFASQNHIGRLADERIYRADVGERLDSVGVSSDQEVPIELVHKTFTNLDNDYDEQLQRLLNLSPLRAVDWINIGPHRVTFRTIKAS